MQESPSETITNRIKRFIIMSFASVVFTLLIIELVVRLVPLYPTHFEQYDPLRGWVYPPHKEGFYLDVRCLGEYRVPIKINSHGLRDIERTYDPPPDTERILLLGDSTVASFEVPLESALHRQVESSLHQMDPDQHYEVLNGGHRGYGTDFEVLFYEDQAHRYQADLVLLVFQIHNDMEDNHPQLSLLEGQYYPYFSLDESDQLVLNPAQEILNWSRAFRRPVNPIHDTLYDVSNLYKLLSDRHSVQQNIGEIVAIQPEWYEEAWDVTEALIQYLRREVEADGSRFGVVITPINRNFAVQQVVEKYEHLETFLAEQNISYIALDPVFQQSDGQNLRFPCDGHWTEAGHELAGDTIARFAYNLLVEP